MSNIWRVLLLLSVAMTTGDDVIVVSYYLLMISMFDFDKSYLSASAG